MARAYPGGSPGLFDEALAIIRRAQRRLRQRRCRLTTRARPIDDDRCRLTVLEHLDLMVDRHDKGLSRSLIANGYWEMWLTEAIEVALRPGMVAIDIGANLGYFSMLMAERVGPDGRVHAFEPNPVMANLLTESAAGNGFAGRIALHGDPLWDSDGEERILRVPTGEPKNAHLAAEADGGEGLRLRTRRLDGFPELLDADVIKIDVEGAEEHVWRGMAGLFAQQRPLTIFLEFTPVRYADPAVFLREIQEQGFALHEISVSHGIRPTGTAAILAGDPEEDRMLALFRDGSGDRIVESGQLLLEAVGQESLSANPTKVGKIAP